MPNSEVEIQFLKDASGEEDLSQVRDLEVIFADLSGFENFGVLQNVQRLAFIDNKMRRIAKFEALGMSLQSLTLTKQGIQRMENLEYLPNLTELFLQRNQIERIENLHNCRKLKRLWLTENRISCIEGLENLVDLRELCLQGNRISKVVNLDNNTSLRTLDLSRNSVTKVKELDSLAKLNNLRELRLQSDTFGACPVVFQESYREYAICTLKQIRMLDGKPVIDEERSQAEDVFLQMALEFNDRVEELHRLHRDELRRIELDRIKCVQQAQDTKSKLIAQFAKLRDVVAVGRAKVRKEQQRQLTLRDQNMEQLKAQLLNHKKKHREIIQQLIEEEKRAMQEEEKTFSRLTRRARLELNEAVAKAEMAQGIPNSAESSGDTATNRVSFQVLCDETTSSSSSALPSELKALCLSVRDAQHRYASSGELVVFRASKVFNSTLYNDHIAFCDKTKRAVLDRAQAAGKRFREPLVAQLYVGVANIHMLKRALVHGLHELATDNAIVLFSNPRTAARLAGSDSEESQPMFRVLKCRAVLPDAHSLQVPIQLWDSLSALSAHLEALPQQSTALKVELSSTDDCAGEYCYLLRSSDALLVLPVIYTILCPECEDPVKGSETSRRSGRSSEIRLAEEPDLDSLLQSLSSKVLANSVTSSAIPDEVQAKLERIESKVQQCIAQYEDRIRQEMDPATAERVEALERSADQLDATLGSVRADIDKEKAMQEQILREFQAIL